MPADHSALLGSATYLGIKLLGPEDQGCMLLSGTWRGKFPLRLPLSAPVSCMQNRSFMKSEVLRDLRLAGPSVSIDIHDEDYVPSAVPPAAVMEANKPRKPAKEGKLARQKAKAATSAAPLHGSDDIEFVPAAALPQPPPKKAPAKAADASPPKAGKEWDDIDLSSPQP